MKPPSLTRRLLAFVLALALCFSLVPWTVFAAETGTYTQVTSAEEFTSGQYVLITDTGYAPTVLDGSWILAAQPTVADGLVTDAAGAIWTLTVDGTSVKLTDANGVTVAPKGGNSNGIKSGDYSWTWSFADGKFTFAGTGSDTVVLASNTGSENKLRGYKTATVSGNPNGYPSTFTAYKLVEENTEPTPSEPVETTPSEPVETTPSEPVETTPSEPTEPEGGETSGVTWTKVEPADITDTDTIAITMTKDGTTWVLPVVAEGGKGQPLASYTGTIAGNQLTTDAAETYSWNFTVSGEGFQIRSGDSYLYVINNNNGIRIGKTAAVWNVVDGYLAAADTAGNTRYLGVYIDGADWRSYKNTTGNTAGQTLGFWKLDTAGQTPEVPENPEVPEIPEEPAAPVIADGNYVIWAPAFHKALSGTYGEYYNNGVDVALEADTLTGYENTEIWTVTNNADGTITISCAGGKLSMDEDNTFMPLNERNDTWIPEDAGDGMYYVRNVVRGSYIQWYAEKNCWTGYANIDEGKEDLFALCFTPAEKDFDTDASIVDDIAQWGGVTNPDNTAFIYGDKYAAGDEKDTEDIFTAVVGGRTVTPWTKGGSGETALYYMGGAGLGSGSNDYLQLSVNATGWGDMELSFRLRSSNSGPGSFRLVYSTDGGTTFRDFTTGSYAYAYTAWSSEGPYPVTGEGTITDGIARPSWAAGNYVSFVFDVPTGADNCGNLIIRLIPGTDKANGKAGSISASGTVRFDSVVLSGSPVVDESVTGFVTVEPDGTVDQPVGTALTMTSATQGATISYRANGGEWLTYDENNKPTLDTLPCNLEAYATSQGKADSVVRLYRYAAGTVEAVKFSPNGGGIYIEGESAEITLSTATTGATIYYATSTDGETFGDFAEYTGPILVQKGFGKFTIQAYAQKEGYTESVLVTRTFTERDSDTYRIFFGQLHSHTNISDGSGSVEEAFRYASNVDGLDFLAVTDHSNSFDNATGGSLAVDGSSISSEWKLGHEMAQKYTSEDFVGLYGFEMTWTNGLGHINTFNTPGWQTRNQERYSTATTALQNYYEDLAANAPESISQFNHPGTTFGDFSDYAHYSEEIDRLITLIEVGNGEGAIGSTLYFPSYEEYNRALDKGWHVAPTNNQDNHKGMWGDANTGRTVILADSLTEADIYDALRNYRVYATEDNDLCIYYTLNGCIMGSILGLTDEENVTISVNISDATDAAIGKVEVIVNGGFPAASQILDTASGTVTLTVPADYNYYYIKITQPDGDIAVTAPVWVGKVEAVGIASLTTASKLTIAGQAQTITAELYNNERSDLLVESLVYTNKATGEVLYTETGIPSVTRESTATSSFTCTFDSDGIVTVTATLKGTLNGMEKVYTKDLEITVMPQNVTGRIIVDGTHCNVYVTGGEFPGSMGNMTAIAEAQGIDVHVETGKITPEMLENCSLLIITAPAAKSGTANGVAYEPKPFGDDFIAMVADYVKAGGSVVLCGLDDTQDIGAPAAENHTACQSNKLLAAIGSTMSLNDDRITDDVKSGEQADCLYPENFNMDSQWCAGLVEGQVYSFCAGCSINVGQGTWLVKGFETTYSNDADGDGLGGTNARAADSGPVLLACEDTGFGGTIFVSGAVFVSDLGIKAEMDSIWDLPYANRTIYENIIGIARIAPAVTPIADVRASAAAELGRIFVIEGYVTAGIGSAYTTFFDAIYVQDETGGITVFPYAEAGLELGTKVRITGYTDAYQGDIELQIMSLEILDEPKNVIEPEKVSAKDAMDYAENGGQLLQVEGEVVEVVLTADGMGVAQFLVKDEKGDLAKVFIDGYILSGTTGENTLADIVQVGNTVSAVGLLYMHPEGDSAESVAVLRVRDCDEVVLIQEKEEEPTDPSEPVEPSEPTEPETDKTELEKAIDMANSKKEADYTKKSWAAMEAALKIAEAVYADEKATQEEIDAATDALNKAIRALVPATGKNPETSDGFALEMYLVTMTVSLLALALLIWNRKRFVV